MQLQFAWRSWRSAVLLILVLLLVASSANFIYQQALPGRVDIGSMDLRFAGDGVAPGWLGSNLDKMVAESHRAVPGKVGTAQEISPERARSGLASVMSSPVALQQREAPAYALSFWYRRMGSNEGVDGAYVGFGTPKVLKARFSLPPAADWTYTELVLRTAADATHISFWANKQVSLQVDEVGLRPLTASELAAVGPEVRAGQLDATAVSQIVLLPLRTGMFTWQWPGIDIGSMELKPSSTGVAGGWFGYSKVVEEVPVTLTHSLVPGRTGGTAQQISTVGNEVTASLLGGSATYLEEPQPSDRVILAFWYQFMAFGGSTSQATVELRHLKTSERKTVAVLTPSTEWRQVRIETELPKGPGPKQLIFKLHGKDLTLQLDDVSLLNHEGIADYRSQVVRRDNEEQMKTEAETDMERLPTFSGAPPADRPPFEMIAEKGRLAFISRHGGIMTAFPSLLLFGALPFLSLAGIAAVSFSAATLLFGLLQGVVLWEPAPVDLFWLLWGLSGLLFGRAAWGRLKGHPLLTIGLALFLAGNLLSAINANNPMATFGYLAVTLYGVGSFFSLLILLRGEAEHRMLRIGLIAGALCNGLLALLAVTGLEPWQAMFSINGRAHGLFKDPNVMGPFLVAASLLLAEHQLTVSTRIRRLLLSLAQATLLSGLLLTQSRAAIGTLLLSAGIYWLFMSRRIRLRRVVLQAAMGMALITAVAAGLYQTSIFQTDRLVLLKGYDSGNRFPVQWQGIQTGLDQPFGIGPGLFEERFRLAAHSLYVRTLTENGWIGLAGMLLFLGYTTYHLWRRIRRPQPVRGGPSMQLLLAWFVGTLVISIVIDTVHWRHFWLYLGIAWSQMMRYDEAFAESGRVEPASGVSA